MIAVSNIQNWRELWICSLFHVAGISNLFTLSNVHNWRDIQNCPCLQILSKPLDDLQKDIPSMADLDPESEASIAEFQRIVKKVEEMKNQRQMLLDELREDILNDDITKKLVIHKENEMPKLFDAELTKHSTKIKFLEQNMKAQANIIQALTEVNAK